MNHFKYFTIPFLPEVKNKRLVWTGLVISACLFLLSFNAAIVSADSHDVTDNLDANIAPLEEEESEIYDQDDLPSDVIFDEKVTNEDLGASEASVLPNSIFHPFKRLGWAVREIVTTNPVSDARLKLEHISQDLAEIKQLVDKQGFSGVRPGTISAAIKRFEDRMENLRDMADALKEENGANPGEVEELLNDLADKQFKYQKLLSYIEKEILKAKEKDPGISDSADDIFISISETKDKTLEHFGEVLNKIDGQDSEKVAEIIAKAADKQAGSEFKHLKNLEVLERFEKNAPKNVKGAIGLAQENALKFFSRDVSALPEDARAERFETYNKYSYGDETRQIQLLDELKLLDDVPLEILQKIEEVKEFAIRKFENKIKSFNNPKIIDSYVGHLSGENLDDIVLAEQLASRAVFEENPEIKQKINDVRDKSVKEFTDRFTDAESQAQAERFKELEMALEKRPGDPKLIKAMQKLENEVRSDPSKAAFIDQIGQLEDKMKIDFEDRFKKEGDKYFDRIGTLDPQDFEAYRKFGEGDFVPDYLSDRFLEHGVDKYRDYVRDIDDPEEFDRFNAKFTSVSDSVIKEIKARDVEFGDAMQFKRQAMEKARFEKERELEKNRLEIDYKERELTRQLDVARRQADEEFWNKINSLPYDNFEERQKLFDEKRKADLDRLESEHKARLEIFNKRLEFDPWCDEECRNIQKQFIEQEFKYQKERIQEDYLSHQRRVELDLSREKQNNPLFGLCDTPESCDSYCRGNPDVKGCEWARYQPANAETEDFGPKDYDCGQGKYFDFGYNECKTDPYYHPPTNFTNCSVGLHWNPEKGFCEKDFIENIGNYIPADKVDCGPDSYFDSRENKCISYRIEPKCDQGFYLGPSGNCIKKDIKCLDYSNIDASCPSGEFREEYTDQNGCRVFGACLPVSEGNTEENICPDISSMFPAPCPAGQQRKIVVNSNGCKTFGQCEGEVLPQVNCDAYWKGYEYDSYNRSCQSRGASGCDNPFKYKTLEECEIGNNVSRSNTGGVVYPYAFSTGYSASSHDEAVRYCYDNPPSSGVYISEECEINFGVFLKEDYAEPYYSSSSPSSFIGCSNITSSDSCLAQSGCKWFTKEDGGGWCSNEDYVPPVEEYKTEDFTTGTCPSFAHSEWDQSGWHYCKLNDREACDFNQSTAFTNDSSYSEANCPDYGQNSEGASEPSSSNVTPESTPDPTPADDPSTIEELSASVWKSFKVLFGF